MVEISGERLNSISRSLNGVFGVVIIILAIVKLDGQSLSVQTGVQTFFWIIYGIIMILTELKQRHVLNEFNFLQNPIGKGVFYNFCGTLLIDKIFYEILFGILMILNGCFVVWVNDTIKKDQQENQQQKDVQNQEQNQKKKEEDNYSQQPSIQFSAQDL